MKLKLSLLIALSGLTFAADAACSAYLKNRNGRVLEEFREYGMNACRDAKRDCNREKARRNRHGNHMGSYCEVERDWDTPNYTSCTFTLVTRNGRTIEDFTGEAYGKREACREARRECQDELEWRQRRGRNMQASCVKEGNSPRPPRYEPPRTTKNCTVYLRDRYDRVIRYVMGSATGNYNQAQEQACRNAMKNCRQMKRRAQTCTRY